jgi:hypothetical protein
VVPMHFFFIVLLGQIYTVIDVLGKCTQTFQFHLDGQSIYLSSRSPNCVFRLTITPHVLTLFV